MAKNEEQIEAKDPHVPFKRRVYDFFKTVLLSIYPDSYSRFSEKRIAQGVHYFMLIGLLTLVITGVLLAITLPGDIDRLTGQLSKFNRLNVTVDMELKEDIELAGGDVRIAESGSYDGEKLFITKENITVKRPSCIVFSPACWFGESESSVKAKELSNVLDFTVQIEQAVNSIAVVVYPALVLGLTIYIILKGLILVLAMYLLSLVITRAANLRLSRRQKMLICIYASTIYLVGEPFSMLLGGIYMAHLVVFTILAVLGIALVGEKRHRY